MSFFHEIKCNGMTSFMEFVVIFCLDFFRHFLVCFIVLFCGTVWMRAKTYLAGPCRFVYSAIKILRRGDMGRMHSSEFYPPLFISGVCHFTPTTRNALSDNDFRARGSQLGHYVTNRAHSDPCRTPSQLCWLT